MGRSSEDKDLIEVHITVFVGCLIWYLNIAHKNRMMKYSVKMTAEIESTPFDIESLYGSR